LPPLIVLLFAITFGSKRARAIMGTDWITIIIIIIAIIVGINARATIELWREAVRRPNRPKKEFIKELFHSEPIVPKHGQPTKWDFYSDDEAYLAKWAVGLGEMHRAEKAFFYDFSKFGDVLNHWFKDWSPWQLQELADNELRLLGPPDPPPSYGRRYLIFHNQTRLGVLEVTGGSGYSDKNPFVLTAIELGSVRLLPLQTVQSLLEGIARYVTDYTREGDSRIEGTERTKARVAIDSAIQRILWATQHVSAFPPELHEPDWGELECHFQGSAFEYFRLIGKR
jgi:hypothetical protein